jgi:hypothetical protein
MQTSVGLKEQERIISSKGSETKQKKTLLVWAAQLIVHNAVQTAADCLPVDTKSIPGKIYQHFHIYTVYIQILKDFVA